VFENIKFKHDHFCLIDNIYYYINTDYNVLIAKSVSGVTLFTYNVNYNLSIPPEKLVFDGTYFLSLHLENKRYIVRKWLLTKELLVLIDTFDYSSIGLLATTNLVFKKFFNRPITYDDWFTGGSSGSYFEIYNNELVVGSYGNNAQWHGPSLSRYIEDVADFKLDLKFFLDATLAYATYVRLYLRFYDENNTLIFDVIFNAKEGWIKNNASYHHLSAAIPLNKAYNNVIFSRYSDAIELQLNGKIIYTEASLTPTINKITISVLRYYTNHTNIFRINNLNLKTFHTEHNIQSDTLCVDGYDSILSTTIPSNSLYVDLLGETSYIEPGTVLRLNNTYSANFEEVTVTGTLGANRYGLSFYTQYEHLVGEKVQYSKYFYMFNNYTRKDPVGAIYVFDYTTGYLVTYYSSQLYYKVMAACWFKFKDTYLLGFVKDTNFLMLEANNLPVLFNAMNMDNIYSDNITLINIYDINIGNGSIYRLQKVANYFGTEYVWTTYNYQLSPLRSFVDSTTIMVYPRILPSDGRSQAKVSAVVKNQYGEPSVSVRVNFTNDDPDGYMTLLDRYTGYLGTTYNYYKSGVIPKRVILEIESLQQS
jgi:hypothetical protein